MTDDANVLGPPDAIERALLDDTNADVEGLHELDAVIRERARAALLVACEGWRERRRCTASDGSQIAHPHPGCLAAQYRFELILLENGIRR